MTKKALVTGITGQDGSYLTELLLSKGYKVYGFSKHNHLARSEYMKPLQEKITHVVGEMNDFTSLYNVIKDIQPDEVYNLASQSMPGQSWQRGIETAMTNGISAHYLYDAVKDIKPDAHIYQASSSEMFGEISETPQNENTPFHPLSPYAAAKLYAHHLAQIYRKSYGMFISCGILFNHESPRRGMSFITQKITYAAACLKLGIQTSSLLNEKNEPILNKGILLLGNLDTSRDWGFAGDYVEAMWLMLQQPKADDFVIGTGHSHSIKKLCQTAFDYVGLNWENYVKTDPRFVRPTETGPTIADISKAKRILGWQPKTSFEDLIHSMVDAHVASLSNLSIRA